MTARRVLVVDDCMDSADLLAEVLTECGGHVTQAVFSGVAALDAAPQFRPDVILLDLTMPDMSGLEVARRLRETPLGQTVVLVAMTGLSTLDARTRTRDAGFDLHLTKPMTVEAVLEAIENVRRPTPASSSL